MEAAVNIFVGFLIFIVVVTAVAVALLISWMGTNLFIDVDLYNCWLVHLYLVNVSAIIL